MPILTATHPTLLDVTKRMDPKGKIDQIAEILNAVNPVLDDAAWVETNGVLTHRTTVRTGIPTATWRKIYGGVQPTKSTTAQITESVGELTAYAEVDATLAEINGNSAEWRLSEERPHIEAFSQQVSEALFYADENLNPERFNGLSVRYAAASTAATATAASEHVISAGSSGGNYGSIWLVGWSPNGIAMLYPKGSAAGLSTEDKGKVTTENIDGSNGRAEIYRTFMQWRCGAMVRDWRYGVRICNISRATLTKNASSGADLIDLLTQAVEMPPPGNSARWVIYTDRTIRTFLRKQIANKVASSTLTMETVGGKPVMMFDGIPFKRCDALAVSETLVPVV